MWARKGKGGEEEKRVGRKGDSEQGRKTMCK